MAEPHLPSLVIEGFRGFKKLELRKLGHVNLLVGKNGVGKSSVLDAVRLYASQFDFERIHSILERRGEDWNPSSRNSLSPLLFERQGLDPQAPSIRLGDLLLRYTLLAAKKSAVDGEISYKVKDPNNAANASPGVVVEQGGQPIRQFAYAGFPGAPYYQELPGRRAGFSYRSVPPEGLSDKLLGTRWDEVVLAGQEDRLTDVFRTIRPDAQKIHIISSDRRPYVSLEAFRQPVPLRFLGDGAARFLGIAVSAVLAKDGFLLLDEFENGIHHSAQPKIWEFVFKVARELNVQVFATTHSHDCVTAFAQAAVAAESKGELIRLEHFRGEVVQTSFDERDALLATSMAMEIR